MFGTGPEGEEVVGYVRAGEPVGEMSLLSGEPHSASVYALRDTEMLRLSRSRCRNSYFMIMENLQVSCRVSFFIARATPRPAFSNRRRVSSRLVASSPSINIDEHAKDLSERIKKYGVDVDWMPVGEDAPDSRTFDQLEEAHDIVSASGSC